MEHVASVAWKVAELLDQVRKDRSDFVLEPAYANLRLVLTARIGLLEQLHCARDEMNAYLKSLKSPSAWLSVGRHAGLQTASKPLTRMTVGVEGVTVHPARAPVIVRRRDGRSSNA
ncbi:hypothetical protein M3A49_01060 [Paraburkholderia sp. CNPSo 3076]|uniref:hypothetical protein n=1 Tax=Paraburkholderia sp. CNPSo 3076 TaxID=2940936 RepID=UPI00224EF5CC|nr:hypothetical protein [Paraburkholderia sp. CNPSo 3076]MCX5538100.1 hypothetical protein [Paraburkholderia sp. CNPSo 3076]